MIEQGEGGDQILFGLQSNLSLSKTEKRLANNLIIANAYKRRKNALARPIIIIIGKKLLYVYYWE